jgi:hypothetical protein
MTSQDGPFEHTRRPVTSALAQSSAVLRELEQVWRDAEAQLMELRQPAALDVGQPKLSRRGDRNAG